MFSQHDNRFKFENDPLVRGTQAVRQSLSKIEFDHFLLFQKGFGRRRTSANARGEFDPFFIGWIPKNVDIKQFNEDTKKTSYANDYNDSLTSSQIISDVQIAPESEVSVYSKAYSHGQPDPQQSKQIRQETFQRYALSHKRRTEAQKNDRSFNVASCLVWNTKNNLESSTCKSNLNFHNKIPTKLYQSQSMQTFPTMKSSREHGNAKGFPPVRSFSSCETTQSTSVESLISKYM